MTFAERIAKVLPESRFARNVSVLAGGVALGQGIAVLVSPILTRLYVPSDFGVLAAYASFLGIFSVVAALRYEIAIPLAETDEDALAVLVLCLMLISAITLMLAVGISFGKRLLISTLFHSRMYPYSWLLPLGVFAVGFYQVFNYWAIRKQEFRRVAHTRIVQGLGMAISQLVLGVFNSGPLGLVVGDIIGRSSGSATLVRTTLRQRQSLFRFITWEKVKRVAVKYKRFPQLASVSGVINALSVEAPTLLIVFLWGSKVGGWFILGHRVMYMPMALIGRSVANVYVADLGHQLNKDRSKAIIIFKKVSSVLFRVGVIPFALLAGFAPLAFATVFGEEWRESGRIVQLIVPYYFTHLIVMPLSQTLNAINRQDIQLGWDLSRLGCVILLFYCGNIFNYGLSIVFFSYGFGMFFLNIVLYLFMYKELLVLSVDGE